MGMLANQMYLYGLRDTFGGFDYKLNYVPGKKAKAETNEADCNSRHPEPLTTFDSRAVQQTEFTVREEEELFEKDIRAVVNTFSLSYANTHCGLK
ncbi:unnamed protein product [Porites lobata]|uniref:Uncharacterized protein n=1 Tax=Porites lobata TaxID=104759 RepID=A0ABN8NVU9_9CNID|nr:unnamed protein product [Porites lobata]